MPAAISAWSHDGFDEMKASDANRPPRGPRGARGGRGGFQGPPGSINPAYAHLPFHPKHRFPAATPPPEESTTTSQPSTEQSTLFDASSQVKLPGQAPAAPVADLAKETANLSLADKEEQPEVTHGVVVNLGGGGVKKPVTVFPRTAEEIEAEKAAERRRAAGTSILYAADPERVPRVQDAAVASATAVSAAQYPVPQAVPQQVQGAQYYQIPPHLQSQQPVGQAPFIPRHASPAYYPQYYSPEGYPNMPTPPPGATPPPLFPTGAPGFFVPPRQSKVEIKAPGPSQSPSQQLKSPLSAQGDAFQPRHHPSSSQSAPRASAQSFQPVQGASPVSSPSPQLANRYAVPAGAAHYYDPQTGAAMYATPDMGGYVPNGPVVYLQEQYPQYYDPRYQQQVDPAILYQGQPPVYQTWPQGY
ncbi:hypothetical protein T439DRAFT_320861 [Meredithblackwellia eburnea MCA 4105]